MRILGLVIVSFLVLGAVQGAEQLVCVAENNVDHSTTYVSIITDKLGDLQKLKLSFDDGTPEQLYTRKYIDTGIVMKEKDGKDIVVLSGEDFMIDRGGTINLTYLTNGITGTKNILKFKFHQTSRGWFLFHEGVKIKKMFFKGRKLLGKTIGIKKVILN